MRLVIAGLNEKHTKKLSDRIEVAVGMKAIKGAPARESRTGGWLVSPRISLEKKF